MNTPGLTQEDRNRLRAPFAGSAVKWLPIGGVIGGNAVMLMPHLNASLVFERLADVDPCWTHTTEPMLLGATPTDPFGLAHAAPWRCSMVVKGVTRHGIGQLDGAAKMDNKHLKTGYSDAIKRAALEFEIGAYLRAFDSVYIPQMVDGVGEMFRTKTYDSKTRFSGLTAAGKVQMRAHYDKIVNHPKFVERYGAPIEYGDQVALDEAPERDDVEVPAAPAAEPTEAQDDVELKVLRLLTRYNGRDTPPELVAETLKAKSFAKCLPQVLNSIIANLGVNAEDSERLRKTAIAAATGDVAAFDELARGLEELETIADPAGQETMPV